jgi:hypothetical protein
MRAVRFFDINFELERWARWRIVRANGGIGWSRTTVLGRMLDDMPSTKCIACNGAGRVSRQSIQVIGSYVTCSMCGGQGRIKADPRATSKINPAFIRSTRQSGPGQVDPVIERLDYLIAQLRVGHKQRWYDVLIEEYHGLGTQKMKAARIGISPGYYSKLLQSAHQHLFTELESLTLA